MAIEETISPIQEAWTDSYLVLNGVVAPARNGASGEDLVLSVCGVLLLLIFLFFYKREIQALSVSFESLFLKKAEKDFFLDRFTLSSIVITFLIAIPLFTFMTSREDIWNKNFLFMLMVIIAYNIVKELIFKILAWVSGKREAIMSLERMSLCGTIMITVLMLIPFGLSFLFPPMKGTVCGWIFAGIALICLIFYYVRGYQIIISSGFSHFLWFLYLCALELLPVCLVFKGFVAI